MNAVEGLKRLEICDGVFGHEADHFASGHLGVGGFLPRFAIHKVGEQAGDETVAGHEIRDDSLGVFLRGQIYDGAVFVHQAVIERVAPKGIKIAMRCDGSFLGHFEAIGNNAVGGGASTP